jgi:glycosyltransferase involved in cell wall biosynthesis
VITTITSGTPDLNKNGQCVLLSEVGDHQALADNIIRLAEDEKLAATLTENGYNYMEARVTNKQVADTWVEAYKAIINHYNNGTPIPISLLNQ